MSKMSTKSLLFFFFSLIFINMSNAQMVIDGKPSYGNEWIDYNKTYYKVNIGSDGIYKIDKSTLEKAGLWKGNSDINKLALFAMGKEVPLFISNQSFGSNDYILFYAEKNKIGLDSFLYEDKSKILNNNVSMLSDTLGYYFTFLSENSTARINLIQPDYGNITVPEAKFYFHTLREDYLTRSYKPVVPTSQNFQYSTIVESEGYVDNFGQTTNKTIDLPNLYEDYDGEVVLTMDIANNQVSRNIKQFTFNGKLVESDTSEQYKINRSRILLNSKDLKLSNNLTIKGLFDSHNFGLADYNIGYPRKFDFEKVKSSFWITSTATFANIINYNSRYPVIDLKNNEAIQLQSGQNNQSRLLLSDAKERKLYFDNDVITVNNLEEVKPKNIKDVKANYLIISSKKLLRTGATNEVENYATFRASTLGGSYKTHVLYAEDIYDQFGYGVPNHWMAFKNLSSFLQQSWPNLEYIFIIGKGREYGNIRLNEQLISIQNELILCQVMVRLLPIYFFFPKETQYLLLML